MTTQGYCGCESAYCTQHGGDLSVPKCDPCPNIPEGHYRELWIGEVCDACAMVARANGFEAEIERIGVWGDPAAIGAPVLVVEETPGGFWPTLTPGEAYTVATNGSGRRYWARLLAIGDRGELLMVRRPTSPRGRWRPWLLTRDRVKGVYGVAAA